MKKVSCVGVEQLRLVQVDSTKTPAIKKENHVDVESDRTRDRKQREGNCKFHFENYLSVKEIDRKEDGKRKG